jgi:hypothetical protein
MKYHNENISNWEVFPTGAKERFLKDYKKQFERFIDPI